MTELTVEQVRQNNEAAIVVTEGDALFDALWAVIHASAQAPVPDTQALAVIPLIGAARNQTASSGTP
ncbi:hypothetical protein [Vreelandella alkaliphila]|uniref:Uncharacterized protein n=1 Tax=Vreelandella alkaliphila TaxID=272774 RepID=A0ABX4HMZ1_9GAMM|nr:hypothetical protein [Halomonas humidisoli]PAU73296.1 hypothetical protein CK497_01455 [Halomonas humidisoli]